MAVRSAIRSAVRSPVYSAIADKFGGLLAYAVANFDPALVLDFTSEYYRTSNAVSTFSDSQTHTRASNATMVDSDGLLKWAPHNLLTYSDDFSNNGAWAKFGILPFGSGSVSNATIAPNGVDYADLITPTAINEVHIFRTGNVGSGTQTQTFYVKPAGYTKVALAEAYVGASYAAFELIGSGTRLSALGGGTSASIELVDDGFYKLTMKASQGAAYRAALYILDPNYTTGSVGGSWTANGTDGIYAWGAHLYRSDLGGMVNNPDTGDSYVPTTSAARYLPRRGNHTYNGSSWVNAGMALESEARTNLFLNSGTLSTQDATVTAAAHTLHFTGTGTITLTGVSTDGPLVGTGTGEENRVSLTFTPTAGTLTCTVSGTVTNAQIELGSTQSSYIPTAGSTVTRAAETAVVAAADMPYDSTNMSIQIEGTMTGGTSTIARWYADASNYITLDAASSAFTFSQDAAGTLDTVTGGSFTSGVDVPFNIASRHGSTFINGASEGTALTENATPVALADLSATNFQIGSTFMGNISKIRVWDKDIGDDGTAEATT